MRSRGLEPARLHWLPNIIDLPEFDKAQSHVAALSFSIPARRRVLSSLQLEDWLCETI